MELGTRSGRRQVLVVFFEITEANRPLVFLRRWKLPRLKQQSYRPLGKACRLRGTVVIQRLKWNAILKEWFNYWLSRWRL